MGNGPVVRLQTKPKGPERLPEASKVDEAASLRLRGSEKGKTLTPKSPNWGALRERRLASSQASTMTAGMADPN